MSRAVWPCVRLLGGATVLGFLLWRLGSGPFLHGFRALDGGTLVAAAAVTAGSTLCCAVRWRLVARGLGIELTLAAATAAYYRSQFLNSTLPGGVIGDVHRGVRHGAGDAGRGLRAVGWERAAGQLVQVALAALVLALLPSPARETVPVLAALVILATAGCVLLARLARDRPPSGRSRWTRIGRAATADLRRGLLPRRVWPAIVITSAAAVAGHVLIFLIAARAVGVTASAPRLVPLALLALLAMSLPTNIAGWGPREGVAAWAFGAAGLGMEQGVAAAVTYGVLVFAACLPGALVLIVGRPIRLRTGAGRPRWRPRSLAREGAVHG